MTLKSKKVLALLVTMLFMISLLAGCGSSDSKKADDKKAAPAAGGKKVIGVLMVDFSDQFQAYIIDGMKQAAEKVKGDNIEVVMMDAKSDANKQMSQMENLISQKVDVVVVMPVDAQAAKPMVDAAIKAGIKVISVNRALVNQDAALAFVGSTDVVAGEMQAQKMIDLLGGKGNIALLEGAFGGQSAIDRKQGYENVLKKYPDVKVTATQSGEWFRDKGMKIMENWLQSGIAVDGVLAQNDEMALGAVKAIEDAGKLGQIKISGIDATPEALKYVKDGRIDFTVFQDAKGQGRAAIETAAKITKGEKVEPKVLIPFELVLKDKADEYAARYK